MLIKGKFVYLKKINLKDDKFIYNLRNKKNISNYLHSPPKSINDQRKWISNNIRNIETLDFIICRNNLDSYCLINIFIFKPVYRICLGLS